MTTPLTSWLGTVAAVASFFASVACSSRYDTKAVALTTWDKGPALVPVIDPQDCDLPPDGQQSGCTNPDCIQNSAALTGFYFGALRDGGCQNHHGVRLVPGALYPSQQSCGGPGNVLSLDADNGELVGRSTTGSGVIVCEGSALEGATFWIEGPWNKLRPGKFSTTSQPIPPEGLVRVELIIHKVDRNESLPHYRIDITGDAMRTSGAGWVPFEIGWWAVSNWQTCLPETSTDQQVVLVQGEVYGEGKTGHILASTNPDWFQFACSESALGKARRMDPTNTMSFSKRLALLHALTARYCGRGTFTFSGIEISLLPNTQPSSGGSIEARWSSGGATCLSHPRLWHDGFRIPYWDSPAGVVHFENCCNTEEELRLAISEWCGGIPLCDPAPTSSDPGLTWSTYAASAHEPETAPSPWNGEPPPTTLGLPRP